jgi:hypothetical protein
MIRRAIGRPGRRGLVGTMATTAVIAGTATAVSGHVAQKQAASAQQAAEAQAYEQQEAAAQQAAAQQAAQQAAAQQAAAQQAAAPAGFAGTDTVTALTQLAALHDQGVLTDEEFAAQKAKVLGS